MAKSYGGSANYAALCSTAATTVVVVLSQKFPSGPETEREVMAFNMKKKFFEQEIENAQQSRPSSSFQSTS